MIPRRIWSHVVKSYSSNLVSTVMTGLVLTATFSIIGTFLVFKLNFKKSFDRLGEQIPLNIYLQTDISFEQRRAIIEVIRSTPGFEEPKHITQQEAVLSFKASMADFAPDLIEIATDNPLPESIEVVTKAEIDPSKRSQLYQSASNTWSQLEGVESVSFGSGWVENYGHLVKSFKISSFFILGVLLAASFLVVANAIKNTFSQKREEIEILELVGATEWDIRLPYLFEGFFLAFASSVMGALATYAVFRVQAKIILGELSFLGISQNFEYPGLGFTCLMIALGGMTGAIGAYLTVRNMNSGWAASMRLRSDG